MLCGSGSKVYSEAMNIQNDGGIRIEPQEDCIRSVYVRLTRTAPVSVAFAGAPQSATLQQGCISRP